MFGSSYEASAGQLLTWFPEVSAASTISTFRIDFIECNIDIDKFVANFLLKLQEFYPYQCFEQVYFWVITSSRLELMNQVCLFSRLFCPSLEAKCYSLFIRAYYSSPFHHSHRPSRLILVFR